MEAQDPLSALADIHLPGDVSPWPPAIGWWILLALVIAGLLYLAWHLYCKAIQRKRLSYAITEIEQAYDAFTQQAATGAAKNQAGLTLLNEFNSVIRRVALLIFPENNSIAKLNGSAWLNFLDSVDNSQAFSTGPGKALGDGIYQRTFTADGEALYMLARSWIQQRYQDELNRGRL